MGEENKPEETQEHQRTFSDAEVKKRLKANSKGDLINIVINLSKRVDAHIAHNKATESIVEKIDSNDGFKNKEEYLNLKKHIKKEVK